MADSPGIALTVNGQPMQVPAGTTVAQLLQRLALPPTHVAVEHNLKVVPRAEQAGRRLNHGDRVEIVTFVGGG